MLRYHEQPRAVPVPGRAGEGRRLALSGELHTLGYYSALVCLGQPGQPYDLIVDTGSSITAVPCAGCRQCGTHLCGVKGRFDARTSSTAAPVVCPLSQSVQGLSCESCIAHRCGYSVRYTEGSSIRGHILHDHAHFKREARGGSGGGGALERATSRIYFGCQMQETGMFFKQQADGIIGLQRSHTRSKVPSVLSSLVREKQSANAFSLCLSSTSGMLLLGGRLRTAPDPLAPRTGRVLTVPMEPGARAAYTLRVQQMRVAVGQARCSASRSCVYRPMSRLPPSVFHPTIVDSGTTFMYASTPVWRALVDLITKTLPDSFSKVGAKHCAALDDQELDALPTLQLGFTAHGGKGGLVIRPRHYMVEYPRLHKSRLRRAAFKQSTSINASASRSYCVGGCCSG